MRREDRTSISSHPLADLGWKLLKGYVIACSSYRAVPLFEPMAVPSSRRAYEDQAGRTLASSVLVSSKARPLASTAQAMRASLLASAIASTLWCNRLLAASIQDLSP